MYLATGDSFKTIYLSYRIGRSRVSEIIPKVCDAIWKKLQPLHMAVPKMQDWLDIAEGFQRKCQFPNCIGAVDGKHVVIQAPPNSGSKFFNYKGTFSIVLMALCDHRHCFTIIDVGAHGSSSDGGIFSQCALGKELKNGTLGIPLTRPLPGGSEPVPHVIVGDEAFPLQTNLMRPFPGKDQPDEMRRLYNYRLCSARRTIEMTFGNLASKWEIYQRRIGLQPQNMDKVIKATCVLHHYIIMTGPPSNQENPDMETTPRVLGTVEPLQRAGNHPFREAFSVRELFKEYFVSSVGAVPWQRAACFGVAK